MTTKSAYDYIVVGAGSSGCVLANRLSADPETRVLLIEAGARDGNPLIKVPVMAGRWFTRPYINWNYQTEPQRQLAGRRISWPRGKVWGGSSSINGMIYVRGHPQDYENWERMGLKGWGWKDVLPYFLRAECFVQGGDAQHGAYGPLPVTRPKAENPLYAAFIRAGLEAGYPECDDFNGADPNGVGFYDYNILHGQRWSSARAYLRPALGRPNLDVISKGTVLSVVLDHGIACGVEIAHGGERQTLRSEREVILAAGVIGSPAILLHSGIGDADRLRSLGIEVTLELPEVGRNLQDHLQVMLLQSSKIPDDVYDLRRFDRAAISVLQALVSATGQATVFPTLAGAFLKSSETQSIPDTQIHFILGAGGRDVRLPWMKGRGGIEGYGFSGSICQLRPESSGEVFLKSADSASAPGIQPNYLEAETDRETILRGVGMMRDIFSQAGFDPYRGDELSPGRNVRTKAEIAEWIAASAQSIYHPVGTCRMGADENSVVDGALRVRGIGGLRVADASIMPRLIGGNTHGAAIMIAEKASDMIRGALPLNHPALGQQS